MTQSILHSLFPHLCIQVSKQQQLASSIIQTSHNNSPNIGTGLFLATAGTTMAVIGWLLLYFWYAFFSNVDAQVPYSFSVRMANCLNPDVALNFGIRLIAQYETQGSNLFP